MIERSLRAAARVQESSAADGALRSSLLCMRLSDQSGIRCFGERLGGRVGRCGSGVRVVLILLRVSYTLGLLEESN